METIGQSEKLRGATAHEEQNSDPGEEQNASSPQETNEQETAAEEEPASPSTPDSSTHEAAEADTTNEAGTSEAAATPRKKRRKKANAEEPFDEKSASPRPSYWPIVLAFSLCVMFLGVAWHPIMIAVGVVLVITSFIGWSLERR
jgi:cobalamin biosynthesis Mg chelatase CobN